MRWLVADQLKLWRKGKVGVGSSVASYVSARFSPPDQMNSESSASQPDPQSDYSDPPRWPKYAAFEDLSLRLASHIPMNAPMTPATAIRGKIKFCMIGMRRLTSMRGLL